ncbi:MAG: hypothetical protein LBR68_00360 [Lachnoclostridium sp.]|jgi:preprotein translocase subunit SecB|nr:hypothetical protein [Lachnoclostridium sp.]
MEAPKALFSFDRYWFDDIELSSRTFKAGEDISVNFAPKCIFSKSKKCAVLGFDFFAANPDSEPFLKASCFGEFVFKDVSELSEIPGFFFANGIAILYPYLRSYISMVTQQANFGCAVILPLSNLAGMKDIVKASAKEIE